MNHFDPAQGAQSAYDFWLSLVPQLMAQFGSRPDGSPQEPTALPWMNALRFPADPIAIAAQTAQQSLQAMAQAMAPMMGAAAFPNLFSQWATAPPTDTKSALEAIDRAWSECATKLGLPANSEIDTAVDRTYGALGDALGLGPARNLQAAWQDLLKASVAQHDARASYALLVNSAFTAGYERLWKTLADKASAGERIDSVLALLKVWALCTEDAVHEMLQSRRGLAATAALTRASLAYYKAAQKLANNVSDMLGMATRRDLDEAFREIQALKRELRGIRQRAAAT